ncbi:MAG: WYL domain-containing protein [Bacteroidales bacterium]|nr:WYL domain-containing protein [Bacteroidales bacterium]
MGNVNSNLFGRYVWLLDLVRNHPEGLTYAQISERFKSCPLNGDAKGLALRTLHNHRQAIADIFGVDIACDRRTNRYYIENPSLLEGDSLRSWLVSSYSLLNQVQADKNLEQRIIFEEVPSCRWVPEIMAAMRRSQVISVEYQSFFKDHPTAYEIEPYVLKISQRRWYLLGRNPYLSEKYGKDLYTILALDRITGIKETEKVFSIDPTFDIKEYFRDLYGIIPSEKEAERVVILAHGNGPQYLRSLPLHESQRELPNGKNGEVRFEYYLKAGTYDFEQALLMQREQIEVLEPEWLRAKLRDIIRAMLAYYD